jgi:GGDEF domain-containing protein
VAGDEPLQVAATFIQKCLCRTDVLARSGGDEFAMLFPETDAAMIRDVSEKIPAGLLAEIQMKGWPVSFSFGGADVPRLTHDCERISESNR